MTGEDRRGELIDVALREFAEHGVEATSMKTLARKAGVSSALFYHYFRSKEELLTLAFSRDTLAPQLTALLDHGRPAGEVLPRVVQVLEEHLSERRHLVWLFLQESRTREAVRQRMVEQGERIGAMISEYLEARIGAGELRPHDTHLAASAIVSLVVVPHVYPCPEGQAQWLVSLMQERQCGSDSVAPGPATRD